jgi:hypothetical protein
VSPPLPPDPNTVTGEARTAPPPLNPTTTLPLVTFCSFFSFYVVLPLFFFFVVWIAFDKALICFFYYNDSGILNLFLLLLLLFVISFHVSTSRWLLERSNLGHLILIKRS